MIFLSMRKSNPVLATPLGKYVYILRTDRGGGRGAGGRGCCVIAVPPSLQ